MSSKPDVSESELMDQLQAKIKQTTRKRPPQSTVNIHLLYPAKPADIPYNLNLYDGLKSAKAMIPNFSTTTEMQQNRLTQLPVLGKVIKSVQFQLHQIARFYAHRALRHQREVNEYLVQCLEQLTIESQKQQRTISQLQQELNKLQQETQ